MVERRAAFRYRFCVMAKSEPIPLAVLRCKPGFDMAIQA